MRNCSARRWAAVFGMGILAVALSLSSCGDQPPTDPGQSGAGATTSDAADIAAGAASDTTLDSASLADAADAATDAASDIASDSPALADAADVATDAAPDTAWVSPADASEDAADPGVADDDGPPDTSAPDADSASSGDGGLDDLQLPDAAEDAQSLDSVPDLADAEAVDVGVGDAPADGQSSDGPPDAPLDVPPACPASCDDGNPCTSDSCDPAVGNCQHTALVGCLVAALPCASSADCKAPKPVCLASQGICVACALAADCANGEACMGNQCVPAAACKSDKDCKASAQVCAKAVGACVDCNVSEDCTGGLACADNLCVKIQPCKTSKECPGVCHPTLGVCTECQANDDCGGEQYCTAKGICAAKACKVGACAGLSYFACLATGSGYAPPVSCDDGSVCTVGEACGPAGCAAGAPKSCDDGNPCTTDLCDAKTGCQAVNNSQPCDDMNPCTLDDACGGGNCAGKAKVCNDDQPCTDDSCAAGACVFAANKAACDDGTACTKADGCQGGKCTGTVLVCDDGNPCTTDNCLAASGCVTLANSATCSDGNPCTTGDTCAATACSGKPLLCNDGNACTADACQAGECVALPIAIGCDDGSACTVGDACQAGACKPGTALNCSDGKPCTDDNCDPISGCVHPISTSPCDDGDPCTTGDKCSGLGCAGTALDCNDANPCTTDQCKGGSCSLEPHTGPCSDNSTCTVGDVCAGGACQAGKAMVCDDKNPCTADTCHPVTGCAFAVTATACDDADGCTVQDECQSGVCKGKKKQCDDGNACTDDSCEAGSCEFKANTSPCPSGGPCAVCSGGSCKANGNGDLWTQYFGSSAIESVYGIAAEADGGGFAVGPNSANPSKGWAVRFGPDGKQLWQKLVPASSSAWFTGAARAGDSWYAGGNTSDDFGQETGWLVRFSEAGDVVWSKSIGASGSDRFWDLSSTGPNVVAVGSSGSSAWLALFDANGNLVGQHVSSVAAYWSGVATRPDGTVVVVGTSGGWSADVVVGAFSAKGVPLWQKAYPISASQSGRAIAADASGIFAVGDTNSSLLWLRIDHDGTLLAQATPNLGGSRIPGAVVAVGNGEVMVGGAVGTSGTPDGFLLRLSAKGDLVWNKTLQPGVDKGYFALAAAAQNTVLTGGAALLSGATATDGRVQRMTGTGLASCACANDQECDDANACTFDTCVGSGACAHTPVPGCVVLPVPHTETFACGGMPVGWKITGSTAPAPVWAVDALPTPPTDTQGCALNFNNGKDFTCVPGGTGVASAYVSSPLYDAGKLALKAPVVLQLRLGGQWEPNKYDNLTLEVTTDDVTWLEVANLDPQSDGSYKWIQAIVPSVGGGAFRVRVRFWTIDCFYNEYVGPFIDEWSVGPLDCSVGAPCNDGNPCTQDACNPNSGCVHTPFAGKCDDGKPCTTDQCAAGLCQSTPVVCNDNNPCTQDACEADSCIAKPLLGPCNDGNACTTGESCQNASCAGGSPVVCNDGNPCTDETCVGPFGCKTSYNTAPCSDGDSCTSGDSCFGGYCYGNKVSCNDNNACTTDSCSQGQCFNTAAADKTSCGWGAYCWSGKCQPAVCGNGKCDPNESSTTCPSDCSPPFHPCNSACGGQPAGYNCFCDSQCKSFGDCCTASGGKANTCSGSLCTACK